MEIRDMQRGCGRREGGGRRHHRRLAFFAAFLIFAACEEESQPPDDSLIRHFAIDEIAPPPDTRGSQLVAVPRSEVGLSWDVAPGAVQISLRADDRELARWSGHRAPSHFVDRCLREDCTTRRPGDVTYSLHVFSPMGTEEVRHLRLRVSHNGLQVLRFSAMPSQVEAGAPIGLAWSTAGAVSASILATPLGGGPTRELLHATLPEAHRGNLDEQIAEGTHYRLRVVAPDGEVAEAEATVALRGASLFTSLQASPLAVHAGSSVEISWKAVGLERLTILRDDGGDAALEVAPDRLGEGSHSFTLSQPTTFLLVGTSTEGEPIQEWCDDQGCREARLSVGIKPRPVIQKLLADPPEIESSETSTLRFAVDHADELLLTWVEEGVAEERLLPPASRSFTVQPFRNTTYTLLARSNGEIGASARTSVQVRPGLSLSVRPPAGEAGYVSEGDADIAWTTWGAERIQLDIDGIAVDLTGKDIAGDAIQVKLPKRVPGTRVAITLSAFRDQMFSAQTRSITLE